MSHSTVLVIGPKDESGLTDALAPFDESIEVERYVAQTRAQQIATRRESHARAAENLRKFRAGEPPYDRPIMNPDHQTWIEVEAPAEAELNDDALWQVILDKESYKDRDENGDIWSTYNPRSRWDWYQVGGRWFGGLILKAGVSPSASHGERSWAAPVDEGTEGVNFVDRLADLDLARTSRTFAVLTPDGRWNERGRMGWWGLVRDGQAADSWEATWNALVQQHQDRPAWLVDVHI